MSPTLPREALGRLIALRWAWLGLEVLAVLVWIGLGAPTPAALIAGGFLVVGAVSNAGLSLIPLRGAAARGLPGVAMVLDALLLTGLLAVSDGATTPLSAAYLVHVVLAALLLSPGWTAGVVVVSVLGYGALFLGFSSLGPPPEDIPSPVLGLNGQPGTLHVHHHGPEHDMGGHFLGMWLTVALVGPFVAIAIASIRSALARARAAEEDARAAAERDARLAALGTLAAGAAHELATPLSTIGVAADALHRRTRDDPALAADAALVRTQVARCREVLSQLAADVGAGFGELEGPVPLGTVVDDALAGLPDLGRIELLGPDFVLDTPVRWPARLIAHALRGVIRNAIHATPGGSTITVETALDGAQARLAVTDAGPGMDPATLARAKEPFFTTKGHAGMGLGLFIASSVFERLGGHLDLDSAPGRGTTVTLTLPLEPTP